MSVAGKIEGPIRPGGVPIVLTSSAAEICDYNNDPFLAFSCTFPHKLTRYLDKYMVPHYLPDGTNKFVPYGLRKVEAILVERFGRDIVATAHPDDLHRYIGPKTKIVGITSMDPMGLAYVSTTYNSLIGFGGESKNSVKFRELIENPALKDSDATVILGGAGIWQITEAGVQEEFGIDILYEGESEVELCDLVQKVMDGNFGENSYKATKRDYSITPPVLLPASYGAVEITRGCGRGCDFCTPTMRQRYSVPIDRIVEEVQTNVDNGCKSVFVISEDVFLYEVEKNFVPNKPAVDKLFTSIGAVEGLEEIHLSHAAIAPVVYNPKILEDISPILLEKSKRKLNGKTFTTAEVGVETGSPALMAKHMANKALPFDVKYWPDIVKTGIGIYNDNGWYPLITMMTGMPDETEDDVIASLELIDDLKDLKLFFTPLLFIPLNEAVLSEAKRIDLDHLTELQFEFITRSWHNNIRIWAGAKRFMLSPVFLTVHAFFTRWKHGPRFTRPLLKMVGMPESMVGGYVGKGCNPEFCIPERQVRHPSFNKLPSNLEEAVRTRGER